MLRFTFYKLTNISLLFLSLSSFPGLVGASKLNDPDLIPHVGNSARESYVSYLYSPQHKAFAVGPGGAWAWKSGLADAETAEQMTIEACQAFTRQRCIAYAVNDKLVFDDSVWRGLWGPYKTTAEVAKTEFGNYEGTRFYNLRFYDAKGYPRSISDFKGQVIFVHFWGSWCPSCMNEFPSLHRLYKKLNDELGDDNFEMVILQVREPYDVSEKWIKLNRYADMPLYNSGVTSEEDEELTLANGEKIGDRSIAKRFPSSFILDKHGVVVFSHEGPVFDWMEYLPFFHDVNNNSGK